MRISNKISIIAIAAMLALSSLFIYISFKGVYKTIASQEESAEALQQLILTKPKNLFRDIKIEGQAAYVLDIKTGRVLYQKNAEQSLPLASITKVMTALVAKEKGGDDKEIIIDSQALATDGESGLKEGEKWKLNELLGYTLIVSSNDGAVAIANALGGTSFINMMNSKARELNLDSLRFINPTGLDTANFSDTGGRGSAKDVATLFADIYTEYPDLLEPTTHQSETFHSETFTHEGKNTDIIVSSIPRMLASKTGYTQLAGGNLGIIFDAGNDRPVAVVVLGSSYDGRFSDVLRLASTTLETYNRR